MFTLEKEGFAYGLIMLWGNRRTSFLGAKRDTKLLQL